MSCYNDNDCGERQDDDVTFNTYLNGYLDESEVDGDRYMIDFVKSVMAQERAVKADMINILKEQILVLRQELFYKQSVIDTLLRNYDPPCIHGKMTNSHHGNAVINPFSNPINLNNPISYDNMSNNLDNPVNKPVITLYSTSNPITSPFSANMVNNHNHNHCNKIHNPLINPYISNNPISSLVSKTVEKYEESIQTCQDTPVITPNILESTTATDLTNWKYRNTPSRLPTNKPSAGGDVNIPKKEGGKPLSETLLSVRNLIKSNIPRPQRENSSLRRESMPNPKKDNVPTKVGVAPSKDVITTHKTFRVKFNKHGWQEK